MVSELSNNKKILAATCNAFELSVATMHDHGDTAGNKRKIILLIL